MEQIEARTAAKLMTEGSDHIYIATTVCALRNDWEQGPDAHTWCVIRLDSGPPIMEVPEEFAEPNPLRRCKHHGDYRNVNGCPDCVAWAAETETETP